MNNIFNPKFFSLLKAGISREILSKDIFAGIIVGIIALPLAIAFAVASGVSPEKGIVTSIVAGFLISILGGSRVQIGGPTGAFIVVVYGIVQKFGIQGLIISTMMAGVLLIIFGLLKLGAVLKFIPHPLIVGFTSGIALIIFSSQIKDALGLQIDNLPAGFVGKWEVYLHHFSTLNYFAVFITLGTILIALYSKKITTKVPGSFIALIFMTVATYSFKLPVSTIETVFGQISGQLSFHLPVADPKLFSDYLQPAVTIAILGAIESLLSAVVADGMISGNHRSNTELIAQGIANLVTPLFGGIPATGAIARTAANVKNGGRTPVSGMVHAVSLLLIMLFAAKWAMLIPMSCLAGILLVVAYNMSEWRSFYAILKGSRYDVVVLLTTFFLTVLVDLSVAIEIGIVLSALIFMQRMSKLSNVLPVEMNSDLIENYSGVPAGIDIYEISGPFFFAAARKYQETLRNIESSSRVLILRMRHVPFIDATGIQNLKQTAEYMNNTGVKLVLSGVQDEVREELEKNRIAFLIGKANIFSNFEKALVHAKKITESQTVSAKTVK